MITLLPANSKSTSVGSKIFSIFQNNLNPEGEQKYRLNSIEKHTKVLVWSQGFQKCIVCIMGSIWTNNMSNCSSNDRDPINQVWPVTVIVLLYSSTIWDFNLKPLYTAKEWPQWVKTIIYVILDIPFWSNLRIVM